MNLGLLIKPQRSAIGCALRGLVVNGLAVERREEATNVFGAFLLVCNEACLEKRVANVWATLLLSDAVSDSNIFLLGADPQGQPRTFGTRRILPPRWVRSDLTMPYSPHVVR